MDKAKPLRLISAYRHVWLAIMPVALAVAVLAWVWMQHASVAQSADQWQARAQACRELGQQVAVLRRQPRRFEEQVLESHKLVAVIEQSAVSAGMNLTQIVAVRPEPARRVRDTPYVESFTRLRITNVSMEQMVRLIWQLQQAMPGLVVSQSRIWAGGGGNRRWEAELTVVGLAYVPETRESI